MIATELFWVAFGSIAAAVGSLATAVSVCFAAKALSYAGSQLQESRRVAEESKKITRGEFLLRLEEFFSQHIETHMRLRPGGEWSDGVTGPQSASEWAPVERYMGLFERIQVLIDDGIIDLATVDDFYGYRVFNIVDNDVIRKTKLEGVRAEYWRGFIRLWQGLKDHRKRRNWGVPSKAQTNKRFDEAAVSEFPMAEYYMQSPIPRVRRHRDIGKESNVRSGFALLPLIQSPTRAINANVRRCRVTTKLNVRGRINGLKIRHSLFANGECIIPPWF